MEPEAMLDVKAAGFFGWVLKHKENPASCSTFRNLNVIEAEAKLDEGNCLLRLGAQALQIQCSENYINDKQLGRGKPSRWNSRKDSFYQRVGRLFM